MTKELMRQTRRLVWMIESRPVFFSLAHFNNYRGHKVYGKTRFSAMSQEMLADMEKLNSSFDFHFFLILPSICLFELVDTRDSLQKGFEE